MSMNKSLIPLYTHVGRDLLTLLPGHRLVDALAPLGRPLGALLPLHDGHRAAAAGRGAGEERAEDGALAAGLVAAVALEAGEAVHPLADGAVAELAVLLGDLRGERERGTMG